MRRVVVTGMGIVSSIGNNTQEVIASLREAKSGIVRADKYAELGFRCQVHGAPTLNAEEVVDRRAAGQLAALERLGRGGEDARCAEAALEAVAGLERGLQRRQRAVGAAEPLHRAHVAALHLAGQHQARAHRDAVDEHGAQIGRAHI